MCYRDIHCLTWCKTGIASNLMFSFIFNFSGGGCSHQGCRQGLVPDNDLRQWLHWIWQLLKVAWCLPVILPAVFNTLETFILLIVLFSICGFEFMDEIRWERNGWNKRRTLGLSLPFLFTFPVRWVNLLVETELELKYFRSIWFMLYVWTSNFYIGNLPTFCLNP